jgi:hypothetical protein
MDNHESLLLRIRLILGFHLATLAVLLRIVLGFCVVLRVELTRFTATAGMVLISMLSAALGAFFTTLSAFLAAAISLVLARAFSATLLALGATRFGLLLLIGLRRARLPLAHCNHEGGQQQCEQHNDYSALSGFHTCSPSK